MTYSIKFNAKKSNVDGVGVFLVITALDMVCLMWSNRFMEFFENSKMDTSL